VKRPTTRAPAARTLLAAAVVAAALAAPLPRSLDAATNQFRGVNWADRRDNFVADDLVLGGLDTSDTYDVTRVKARAILGGFEHDLGANTVRLPVNYPTVSGSYWPSYAGVIDEASRLDMKVVLSYWESSGSKDGKVDDLAQFWSMWRTIVDQYAGDRHVYFEPMNEPHGYSAPEWKDLAAEWMQRYPTVPRGRVIVSGSGYNQNGTTVGGDPRFDGCLISIHIYGFWHANWTTEQQWKDALTASIGPYANRTIISEFGAPMTTGLDYTGGLGHGSADHFIAFMTGVPNRARELNLGTIYWPGLRVGDPYSLETLHGTGTDLSLTLNSPSGRGRLRHSWGR
jgi:Cellulase (glycosyl hydrolase family 5)